MEYIGVARKKEKKYGDGVENREKERAAASRIDNPFPAVEK